MYRAFSPVLARVRTAHTLCEQTFGGAIYVFNGCTNGEVVFDGSALIDTSAQVRAERAARRHAHGCDGRRAEAATVDWHRVQGGGGAIYMATGLVTFEGGSSILGAKVVRRMLSRHAVCLWVGSFRRLLRRTDRMLASACWHA
jgi:hypothetical protein